MNLTPYQTPKYGQQTPSPLPSAAHLNGPFLHPGAVTPSQRTPTYRGVPPTHSPLVHSSPHPSPHARPFSVASDHGRGYDGMLIYKWPYVLLL